MRGLGAVGRIWVGILLIASVGRADPVPAPGSAALDLNAALRLALKDSPSYDSAEKSQHISELQYKNAVAKLLPSIDFTSTDGLQNNIPIASEGDLLLTPNPTAPWYSTLTLGLTETLYDNGTSITNMSIADLHRQLTRITELKARNSLALGVADQFYQFSLASALLEVRKQQQAMINKQFRILSSEYQQGFKTRADYLRLKTQVQQAEIDRFAAEDALAKAVASLRQLIGVNLQAGTGAPLVFAPLAADRSRNFDELERLEAPDLSSFYDAREARIQEEIDDRSVDLAWRAYYPQVSANAGVSYYNQNFINGMEPFAAGHQLSWQALVTVQYNFWDWGSLRRNVEIAQGNRDVQKDALDLNLQQVRETIDEVMADLARIRQSFMLTRELLNNEEESNALVENQYRDGKVTYLDLITSISNLLQAKTQFYNSYFEALQNLAKLDYYKGKIYESLVEK